MGINIDKWNKSRKYGKRHIRYDIKLTDKEAAIVRKKAEALKMPVGRYIRTMAIQGELKIYDLKELQNLLNAFRRIGTNVNQIAAVVNTSGSVYQKDIEDMQEQFKYFNNVMKNYLRELKPKVLL